MKKSQKMRGLIAMIAVALFIDFIVLFGSNLSWGSKLVITGISVSGQIIAIWSWLHMKPRPHKIQKGEGRLFLTCLLSFTRYFFCSKHFLYSRDLGCDPKRKFWY